MRTDCISAAKIDSGIQTQAKSKTFSGRREADAPAPTPVDYRGAVVTIHDDRSICAHAGHCTDGLPGVFKYGSEPWIDPAGADVAAVVATIRQCPSGALRYSLDMGAEADMLDKAIAGVLAKGLRTGDIMQPGMTKVGTSEMGKAIVEEFAKLVA